MCKQCNTESAKAERNGSNKKENSTKTSFNTISLQYLIFDKHISNYQHD